MKFQRVYLPLLSVLLLGTSVQNSHAADAALQADNQSINTACAADAQTAGCGTEVVGKGLLRCLHAYKKAHHEFKFAEACKAAMKQRHSDEKAGK